jgi:hypothetical protein
MALPVTGVVVLWQEELNNVIGAAERILEVNKVKPTPLRWGAVVPLVPVADVWTRAQCKRSFDINPEGRVDGRTPDGEASARSKDSDARRTLGETARRACCAGFCRIFVFAVRDSCRYFRTNCPGDAVGGADHAIYIWVASFVDTLAPAAVLARLFFGVDRDVHRGCVPLFNCVPVHVVDLEFPDRWRNLLRSSIHRMARCIEHDAPTCPAPSIDHDPRGRMSANMTRAPDSAPVISQSSRHRRRAQILY